MSNPFWFLKISLLHYFCNSHNNLSFPKFKISRASKISVRIGEHIYSNFFANHYAKSKTFGKGFSYTKLNHVNFIIFDFNIWHFFDISALWNLNLNVDSHKTKTPFRPLRKTWLRCTASTTVFKTTGLFSNGKKGI